MLIITKEILDIALDRKFDDKHDKSLNWYVYDTFTLELGHGGDSLSEDVKKELTTLGLFDWTK